MQRNFEKWFSTFTDTIATYQYYTDFKTIYSNAEKYKIEINILNSLIGSKDIENDFEKLINQYPNVLKCIPILLAVRKSEITVIEDTGRKLIYNFKEMNYSMEQYKVFMRETGLFDLISHHIINNLYDYCLGVESGLNSNARKNRGGHLMENLIETNLKAIGLVKNKTYFKEMYLDQVEEKWKLDMSFISNNSQTTKRFDFVVFDDAKQTIYGIETNFYASSGSKLNETSRSYKMIAEEAKKIPGFRFVWVTDGVGWKNAKRNLKEAFDSMEYIYNLNDIENGIMKKLFI